VEIRAFRAAGAFYGVQTLLQLLPPEVFRKAKVEGQAWQAPCVKIEDRPRFGWRGVLIDPARHFLPKEGILRFIDTAAQHKLNVLQLHLTDDTGWRIEIKKYPKLTQVGAYIPEYLADYDPPKPKNGPRGGFYTQNDLREIAAYPEVGVPGSNVINGEDSSIRFMQDVLDEVLAIFPSKFIHIGGDEVDKSFWQKNARVQELIQQRGLKNVDEYQSWIIKQMDTYLASKGRRLLGWDEILEGGLAPGATVMSWRGIEGGIAAAKAGHDVVMSPTSNLYLDYYQAEPAQEPLAIGGYLPLEAVYRYEPVPSALNAKEAERVLGLQGNIWGEFTPNMKHIEYLAWPRLAAVSEIGWSSGAKDFVEFSSRLAADFARLDVMGVRYRPLQGSPIRALGEWSASEASAEWVVRECDASAAMQEAGPYTVRFAYTHGASRFHIRWAELVRDGKVVARDEHPGSAAWEVSGNTYTFAAPGKGRLTVRAEVRYEGSDSHGIVYAIGPD
jgi:hexosaminidase